MANALDLIRKGTLVVKQDRLKALFVKIDQLIENISVGIFHFREDDLDSIKDVHVLHAAQELTKVLTEARALQKELRD